VDGGPSRSGKQGDQTRIVNLLDDPSPSRFQCPFGLVIIHGIQPVDEEIRDRRLCLGVCMSCQSARSISMQAYCSDGGAQGRGGN
jgi:hypothetical protein